MPTFEDHNYAQINVISNHVLYSIAIKWDAVALLKVDVLEINKASVINKQNELES